MPVVSPLDLPAVGACVLIAAVSTAVVLRARAAAMRERVDRRAAERTQAILLGAVRELVAASRASPQAVIGVLEATIRASVPEIDAVAAFERFGDRLLCTHAAGERLEHFRGRSFSVESETVFARALRDGARCLARPPEAPLHPSDRTSLAVPLLSEASAFAVVAVGSRSALPQPAVELVVALAEQATPAFALALERAEDHRRATADGLTGLLTPRAFRGLLKDEIAHARADPRARLAALFVDTDHFKDWNDTYGHACGDAVLLRLATLLREHAQRSRDLVARNGGDEFCVVLAGVEKSEALARAEALCAAIAHHDWDRERPAGQAAAIAITASIGVATFPRDAASADELLEKADAAMYHSKRGGRNRVSYYVDGALVSTKDAEVRHDRGRAR